MCVCVCVDTLFFTHMHVERDLLHFSLECEVLHKRRVLLGISFLSPVQLEGRLLHEEFLLTLNKCVCVVMTRCAIGTV